MNSSARMLSVRVATFFIGLLISGFARAVEVPLDTKQSALRFTGHALLHDFSGEAKVFGGMAEIDPKHPVFVLSAKINIQAGFEST